MIKDLSLVYEGEPLSGANEVVYLPILRDCTLTGIDILTDENVAGDCLFSVSRNGVLIEDSEITVESGTRLASSATLAVDLVKGDEIILNMLSGSLNPPITLNLVTDDGEAGSEIASTDDLPEGAMKKYFTNARVLATDLLGYVIDASNTAIAAGDTILQAFQKIQGQINTILGTLNNKINSSYLDTDGTLAANPDTKIATQKAVKTYVAANAGGGTVAGTSGKISKFTGASTVGDSNLSDDGSDITANDKTLSRFSAKINDQTGTTYTLNLGDNGKIVTFSNAAAITVTVPSTLGLGFSCVIYQKGAGQITVVAGSGATLRNPNPTAKTRAQYSTATVFSVVASEFVLAGDIAQS